MDKGLQRQLGVKPQVSVKDRVAWFYWDQDIPFLTKTVSDAVLGGSLAVYEFHVITRVEFHDGHARLVGVGMDLPFESQGRADGLYSVELTGFAGDSAELSIYGVSSPIEPKIYQNR